MLKSMFYCSVFVNRGRLAARAQAPGMGAVMRRRRAAGLPRRRGDQWGATSATFAGQERAACAFERTARRRRVRKRISARALRRPEAESVAPPRRQWRRADGRRPSASGICPTAAPRTQAPGRPEKNKNSVLMGQFVNQTDNFVADTFLGLHRGGADVG